MKSLQRLKPAGDEKLDELENALVGKSQDSAFGNRIAAPPEKTQMPIDTSMTPQEQSQYAANRQNVYNNIMKNAAPEARDSDTYYSDLANGTTPSQDGEAAMNPAAYQAKLNALKKLQAK